MESVLEDIQEYIEKVTVNNTDKHLIIDRKDPGNVVLLKYIIVKPCPKPPSSCPAKQFQVGQQEEEHGVFHHVQEPHHQ